MPRVDLRAPPESQLARHLAGTAEQRRRDEQPILAQARSVDPEALRARLEAERLLGVLGPRLPETANVAGVRRAAAELGERAAALGTAMELLAESVIICLHSASIPATTLKGAALSRALYGNPGLRAPVDVDVLVPAEDLGRAVDALRQLGYGAPADPVDASGLPLLHLALPPPPGLVPVELHWRIHWYETRFAGELFRLDELAVERRRAIELVALLCFYARDGFAGLRLAADIATWWDLHGSELSPRAFAAVLGAYPELRRAVITAMAVARDVVGLPFERIVESPDDQRHVAGVAVRRANWAGQGSVEQVSAQTALFDMVMAPRGGRLRAARRQLLKPAVSFTFDGHGGLRRPRELRVMQLLHPIRSAGRFAIVLLPTRLTRVSDGR